MKDYLKNLFAARGAAFWLNLLGLSLAFVIFYVLMAEVKWVHNFDKCYRDSNRIFQVRRQMDASNDLQAMFSILYSLTTSEEIAAHSPAIEYATFFMPMSKSVLLYDAEHTERTPIPIGVMSVSPDFAHVFGFDMVEGNATLPMETQHVLVPLSFVRKLFGEQESYVGRIMTLGENGKERVIVGGVYRDLPENASLGNDLYLSPSVEQYEADRKKIGNLDFMVFVRLYEGTSFEGMFDDFRMTTDVLSTPDGYALHAKMAELSDSTSCSKLKAIPFSDVCFMPKVFEFGGKCNRYTYWLYIVLAGIIVLIASINYMNFALAKIPYIMKGINVRKILGERTRTLRSRMVGETLMLGILAFFLSVFILWVIIQNGLMDKYMQCDLALVKNISVLGGLFLIALIVPLLASVYPTWYTTSRKPAMVINGNYGLSVKGRSLRRGLIGMQFSISLLVIVVLLLMNAQHYYIRHTPVGYARDSILYVKPVATKYNKELKIRLKQNPSIVGIAKCDMPIGTSDMESIWAREIDGRECSFRAYRVDADFMKIMGIPIIEGRDFREDDKNDKFIFNESARVALRLTNGDLGEADCVGFISDIQTCSFRKEIVPTGFNVAKHELLYHILRVDSPKNFGEVKTYVKNVIQELYGTTDGLEIFTADEALESTYEEENKQTDLLLIGSVASLLISLIGVFGLVLFETQARRKEVGIRKVFGATTKRILVMFNWEYLRILVVCFVIAAPVAYSLYERWIETFAYRTPMHWWLFGVAFLLVAAVICLTVTVQSWRAAKERPVDTIMK